jgi:sporulation protein YabP
MQTENRVEKRHDLMINSRKKISLSGIVSVKGFDDCEVLLETCMGKLTVEGRDLRVTRLAEDSGEVCIEGTVNALYYSDAPEKKGGFFSRLTK